MKNPREIAILRDRAVYKDNQRSGWKPGFLCLAVDSAEDEGDMLKFVPNQCGINLRFYQGSGLVWQTSGKHIKAISVETRALALGKKRVLGVMFADSALRNRKAWFAVSNAQDWRQRLDGILFFRGRNDDSPTDMAALGFAGERRPIIDVLDQGDYIEIIMELLGVGADNVVTRVNSLWFEVFLDYPPFYQRVVLPTKTESIICRTTCNNGFLHAKLKKCARVKSAT